jgi:hypothetical protein
MVYPPMDNVDYVDIKIVTRRPYNPIMLLSMLKMLYTIYFFEIKIFHIIVSP